jgi:hypothetical protein
MDTGPTFHHFHEVFWWAKTLFFPPVPPVLVHRLGYLKTISKICDLEKFHHFHKTTCNFFSLYISHSLFPSKFHHFHLKASQKFNHIKGQDRSAEYKQQMHVFRVWYIRKKQAADEETTG